MSGEETRPEVTTPHAPGELRRGAVGLWEAVFQSFSFVGPAGDVAILLVGTAAFALGATPWPSSSPGSSTGSG